MIRLMKQLYMLTFVLLTLTACSTTSSIPDDDHLFVGLTKISYDDPADKHHRQNLEETKVEVEAALATAPNGALFGSSYYRTPFPYGLWIWNHFSDKEGKFAEWMTRSFGKQPVLMSAVNPALRASVAQQVLKNHGYMHGRVSYDIVQQHNPKKQKIGYNVSFGPLLTVDSIAYVGFSGEADSLIASSQPAIKKGDAFTVAALDAERKRISEAFRNNGYFYYQPSYSIFLADTISSKSKQLATENSDSQGPKASLRFQLAGDLPPEANRQWYIGHVDISMRKSFMEELSDSIRGRFFTFRFNGRKPPLRPRVLMGSMRIRPRQPYSYDKYLETLSKLNATGLFSMIDISYTPRDTTATCDTLDVSLNCMFERPYDFYVETNFMKRTIGRMGPQMKVGLTKRNAFHGGEKLDINLHGSYEWATHGTSESMNAYEYGADAAIEFPRIVAPFFGSNRQFRQRSAGGIPRTSTPTPRRRRFFSTPTTLLKFSSDVVRRPNYYKMHIVSGELTYRWQTSANSRHEFSPLTVKYQFMNSHTALFDSILISSPFLMATMDDYFIPQMRYTYIYTSPTGTMNPIRWETTLSEAGNLTSVAMMAFGKKWNEQEKELFKNVYSQFVRLETDFTKTWQLSTSTQLVGHLHGGVIYAFGNTDYAPFSELFYIGGANSVRAFPIRGYGPGRFLPLDNSYSYLFQTGDISLVGNLELRHRLFGNLHGALFLDAGNVWNIDKLYDDPDVIDVFGETRFHADKAISQMALGTGVGLRYDLDFLILRLDWGIGLHVPYPTSKHGFYNIDRFRDAQTLHFAIGYPF